jgi:Peptidase S46
MPGHLRWSPRAPLAGEVVFAAGNPGGTFRDETVSQLEVQRDVALPLNMTELAELRGRMIRFGEESGQNQRIIDEPLMDVENDYKVAVGRLATLDDARFMAAKRASEADLRGKALAKMGADFGDPWADMAAAQAALPDVYVAYHQLEIGPRGSNLFDYARDLVRAAAERQKPSADRLPGYADAQLPAMEKALLDPVPLEPTFEQLILEFWLSKTRERLTADDPATRLLLGAESPEELATRLATTSRLGDPTVRRALWEGGAKAIAASDDPMIRFMVRIDP